MALEDALNNSDLSKSNGNATLGAQGIEQKTANPDAQSQDYLNADKEYASQLNKAITVSPKYTNEDIFPGANQDINKGYSSGVTGSIPIYVASGELAPVNMFAKRAAAIEEAKALRKQTAFGNQFQAKRPTTENARYQQKIDDRFMNLNDSYIKEAKSVYGKDWSEALKSGNTPIGQRYQRELANLDTLKRNIDDVTSAAATVIADHKAGTDVFSEETLKAADEIYRAIGRFEKGEIPDIKGSLDILQGSMNMDIYLHKNIFPNLKAALKESQSTIDKGDRTISSKKSVSDITNQAEEISTRLTSRGGFYYSDPLITKDMLKSAIISEIGKQIKTEYSNQISAAGLKQMVEGQGTEEDASNRLNKMDILTNPLEGINLDGVIVKNGVNQGSYKRTPQQLTEEVNRSKAKAALGPLVGTAYLGGEISNAQYEIKEVDGAMVPYLKLSVSKLDSKGKLMEGKPVEIKLNDPSSVGTLNNIYSSAEGEAKVTMDQLEKASKKKTQVKKPLAGSEKAKEEQLTLEEYNAKGGKAYKDKKAAEGVTIKIKESVKNYTSEQESNIKIFLANQNNKKQGATRADAISALGY